MFYKMHRIVHKIRQIETVEPNHRTGAVLAVIVPIPCWGQNDIAAVHLNTTTVNSSEAAIAFDDKAHGKGRVAMCWRRLIWHDQLEPGIDGVGCKWCIWHILVSACFREFGLMFV